MPPQILPAVDRARLHVHIYLESVSEGFDVADLSAGPTEPNWIQKLLEIRPPPTYVDQSAINRTFTGTATVCPHVNYKGPPLLEHWPNDQKVIVKLKKKNYVWLDKNFKPMLGYVDPYSLNTEYRRPESVVYVDLELLPEVADYLWKAANESMSRPNTRSGLSMEWLFTTAYKNDRGEGSGFALWFPSNVLFHRDTRSGGKLL